MANNFKDDDQFFVVFFGTKRGNEDNEFANVVMGIFAIAIVMLFSVTLLNDADRRRVDYQNPPTTSFDRVSPPRYVHRPSF